MLSVVRLYIFFQSVSRCPHVTQLTPGCYYCTQKSEALKRLVNEKKGKSVKKGEREKKRPNIWGVPVSFPSSVTTNAIQTRSISGENPSWNAIHVFLIGGGRLLIWTVHMNELIAATNKARSTYDATCVFCADEVSTLGRQFSGRLPCVVGIRAEEKKNC